MENMVYQGTVLGPPLWLTFFADSCLAIRAVDFEEIIFADDLNVFQEVSADLDDAAVLARSAACQSSLHEWGRANRVQFDSDKESHHIVSRTRPARGNFKILGVVFDPQLLMHDAIENCVTDASWRVFAILRLRMYHSDSELLSFFQSARFEFSGIQDACHCPRFVLRPLSP